MPTKKVRTDAAQAEFAWRLREGWEADAKRCAAAGDDALLLGEFPNAFDASAGKRHRRGRSLRAGRAMGKVKST